MNRVGLSLHVHHSGCPRQRSVRRIHALLQERHKGKEKHWNLLALTLVRIYRARMVRHSCWLIAELAVRCGLQCGTCLSFQNHKLHKRFDWRKPQLVPAPHQSCASFVACIHACVAVQPAVIGCRSLLCKACLSSCAVCIANPERMP